MVVSDELEVSGRKGGDQFQDIIIPPFSCTHELKHEVSELEKLVSVLRFEA
jgi:hypothetical protein